MGALLGGDLREALDHVLRWPDLGIASPQIHERLAQLLGGPRDPGEQSREVLREAAGRVVPAGGAPADSTETRPASTSWTDSWRS